jgi:hypothetical protein
MMVEIPLEDLVDASDAIFTGKVLDIEAKRGTGKFNIVTRVTFLIEDRIKPVIEANKTEKKDYLFRISCEPEVEEEAPDEVITIEVPGGKIGDMELWVEDQASFFEDEHVLVFLRELDNGNYAVYGGFQGKYVIQDSKVINNFSTEYNNMDRDEFVALLKAAIE